MDVQADLSFPGKHILVRSLFIPVHTLIQEAKHMVKNNKVTL